MAHHVLPLRIAVITEKYASKLARLLSVTELTSVEDSTVKLRSRIVDDSVNEVSLMVADKLAV